MIQTMLHNTFLC